MKDLLKTNVYDISDTISKSKSLAKIELENKQ